MSRFLVDRGIFEKSFWTDVPAFRLFFLLVGRAAFTDGVKAGPITLRRGQWLRSIRKLQEDLTYYENGSVKEYSTRTIKRCIDDLVEQGRLEVEELSCGTLFYLVNYSQYQEFPDITTSHVETLRKQRGNAEETIITKQTKQTIPPVSPPRGDSSKKACRLSEDWEPTQALLDWATEKHPAVDPVFQTTMFKNHFLANGKRMLAWDRAWQNWIARALDFGRPNPRVTAPLARKSRNQTLLEAWQAGKNFVHKPSGATIQADGIQPFNHLSQQVTTENPTAFRSRRTGDHAFFTEFEIVEDTA